MGGSEGYGEWVQWEIPSPSDVGIKNLVLVGRTGNGKSATANSILGTKAFKSKTSFSGVTKTCELQSVRLQDGQILNVIDTPGLFDVSLGYEFIGKEIANCIDLAKDGIHALLFVLQAAGRFSEEEEAALKCLQTLFGSKIVNYMIVVFTGGDAFDDKEAFDGFLDTECPKPLKDILRLCGNRFVLFDNRTEDETKRAKQLEDLLSLVNSVLTGNGEQPFSNELFAELKRGATIRDQQKEVASQKGYTMQEIFDLQEQMDRIYEWQLRRITETVVASLKESITSLERQLAEERAERKKAEEQFRSAQEESNDEIRKLRENLENAQRERENQNKCSIL